MSEQAATQTKAAAQAASKFTDVELAQAHDPLFFETKWGAVAVYGHELVSKKELLIMQMCLNVPTFDLMDHGVRAVVIRKDGLVRDGGKGMHGVADLNTACFAIDLMEIFSKTVTECMDDEHHRYSIVTGWHSALIETFLHEVHHIHVMAWDREVRLKLEKDVDGSFYERFEKDANDFAEEELFRLAKTVDIEPDHPAASPFFGQQLMELLSNDESAFAKEQRRMLEEHIFFQREAKENEKAIVMHSFKEYCHGLSGDPADDPSWQAPTIQLPDGVKTFAEAMAEENTVPEQPQATAEPETETAPSSEQVAEEAYCAEGGEVYEEYYDSEPVSWDDAAEAYVPPNPGAACAATPQPNAGFTQPAPQPNTGFTQPVGGPPPMAQPAASKPYTDPGFGPERTRQIVYDVFNKIYTHVFTHCGRPFGFPETVQQAPDGGQCCVANVWQMPIPLTPEERAVVVGADCLDGNGKYRACASTENGELRGQIASKAKIPMYKLHINFCGDHLIRLVLPQNPNKPGSKPAAAALQGQHIMYVIDGVDKKDGQGSNFLFKCVDGNWMPC